MAGGGGGDDAQAQQPSGGGRRGHRHHQKAALLPLDIVMAEIAALSDPATLVRCAAMCRDARRRIAEDPSLGGRLRLRDTERFVPTLLRGNLAVIRGLYYTSDFKEIIEVYMVDTTAADATRLVEPTFTDKADGETLRNVVPVDSRGGLVPVRATTTTTTQSNSQLLVCNLATRRCQALPLDPALPGDDEQSTGGQYVLLVGGSDDRKGAGAGAGAGVGQPFQVLKTKLEIVLSEYRSSYYRLLLHTFSSEHGVWSPRTEIPVPDLHGRSGKGSSQALVVGDVVHWLCLTVSGGYILMLHVGEARVKVTSLPASFPRYGLGQYSYLLATATAGGNAVVLVGDSDKISVWEQSKPQPQVVIENETILGFKDDGLTELIDKERKSRWGKTKHVPGLLWFGERSGVVLLQIRGAEVSPFVFQCCLLWLDLHSKKIVRCFSDRLMQDAKVHCPYEVDLSSWLPTFNAPVTL